MPGDRQTHTLTLTETHTFMYAHKSSIFGPFFLHSATPKSHFPMTAGPFPNLALIFIIGAFPLSEN